MFGGIEPVPGSRLVRTTDPISEQLTRTDVWEMGVPDPVRLLWHHDPVSFDCCIPPVEQTKAGCGGMPGEEQEVHTVPVPDGT